MNTITLILLTLAILSLLFGFYIPHKAHKRTTLEGKIKHSLRILDKLYQNINGMEISLSERRRLKNDNPSFTYGEINLPSLAVCLAIVKPKPGEVFYDLGSGAGKAVFCAALLNDWKRCIGIELLPALYDCTQSLLIKLKQLPNAQTFFPHQLNNIHFHHGDIMASEFSDADVVYINATVFSPDFWDTFTPKFETLKSGARIIVLTKKLNPDQFELIEETALPMSWGVNSVFVYRRK